MLRLRLILWYSLLVVLTIVAIGFVQNVLIERSLLDALDQSLVVDAQTTLKLLKSIPKNVDPETIVHHSEMHTSGSMREIIDQVLSEVPDTVRGESLTDHVMSRFIDEILSELSYDDSTGRSIDPMDAIVDRSLSSRQNNMIEIYLIDTVGGKPTEAVFFRTKNLGSDAIAKYVPKDSSGLVDTSVTLGTVKYKGEPIRVVRATSRRFLLYIGFPITDVNDTVRRLQSSFLYLVPLALLVSILGGLWLARKALRPIEHIADMAREIGAKNLSQRIELPGKTDRELMILTETLNSMFARLENNFRQVTQFTSDASHELKTPLAIMKGEIEQAQRHLEHARTLQPQEAREVLESLMEEVERMQRIVEGLLMLSRADDKKLPLTMEEVDIYKFLTAMAEDAEILAEERGLRLEKALTEAARGTKITADPTRLYQVVMNLLGNALKYTAPGGIVTLFLHKNVGSIEFGVSDTGIGIAEEDVPKIFQRFFRTDTARSASADEKENARSLGLGLAIVKSIVEGHGGTIRVESRVGEGTSFGVTIPLLRHEEVN